VSETVAEYWTRKRAELALLARAVGQDVPAATTRMEILRAKQRLRAALHAQVLLADPSLTESAFGPVHPGRFRYTYQRFNLRVATRGFFEDIYRVDRRRGPAFGLWGSSGTGMVTATLRALSDLLDRPRRLLFHNDGYFETRGVLPLLDKLLPNQDDDAFLDGDIFYLDSITVEDRFSLLERQSLKPLWLLLFDTTCYEIGSPLIDRVIARCAGERVPLLLLRSHLKLDFLATEYARLGSVCFWMPPRPPPSLVAQLKELKGGILNEQARAGSMVLPASLFPLSADPEFRALNAARYARIVAANRRAAAGLAQALSRVQVTLPHHGCFLFLETPNRRESRVVEDRDQLAARLSAAGIDACAAPSFGYDVVSFGILASGASVRLRVGISDLPDEDVDRLVQIVANYWHMYR
jgi:hypothetical protein